MRIWMSVLMIFLMVAETTAQCSMCRAVLESGDAQETAKGINNGIIYLMAIPYVLVAFVGYQIFKLLKK
jgi:heme/copper-type cytochrome/quinol oxidase subunit 2